MGQTRGLSAMRRTASDRERVNMVAAEASTGQKQLEQLKFLTPEVRGAAAAGVYDSGCCRGCVKFALLCGSVCTAHARSMQVCCGYQA